MKLRIPIVKRDRRQRSDRRSHTRSGRRQGDSQDSQCPWCASYDIDKVGAPHGVAEYKCRACQESWISVSAKPRS